MKLLVNPEEVWYQIKLPDECEAVKYFAKMSAAEKAAVRSRAATLYAEQAKKYHLQKEMSPADRQWFEAVLKEGTMSDKISALLLQAQECPFYSLEWVTKLLEAASSTVRNESYPALEALKDIFNLILPPKACGRALTAWKARPMTDNKELTPSWFLMLAYFEDMLKQAYTDFLKVVEIMLHDQVQNGRERAMRILYELALSYKFDYTETILVLLVNKLGDPQRKVASRVVYYLQSIVEKYDELTLPVVKAIQNAATQPKAPNDKAAFYGLTFFSQVRLNDTSPEVTNVLLSTYQYFLELFLIQLDRQAREAKKKNKLKNKRRKLDETVEDEMPRTAKVILLGLTRAIPFARSTGQADLDQYAVKLLSIAGRIKCFSTLLKAAGLIYKISCEAENMNDSMLQLLSELVSQHLLSYSRMGEATSTHPQLFKLLYKIFNSLSESAHPKAVPCLRRMIKALMSVSVMMNSPAFPAAALLLVNEALSVRPGLRLAICFPEESEEASFGLLTELNIFSRHFHPTVARYASTLLEPKGEIDISKEPDDPFTCMANVSFLEKFAAGTL